MSGIEFANNLTITAKEANLPKNTFSSKLNDIKRAAEKVFVPHLPLELKKRIPIETTSLKEFDEERKKRGGEEDISISVSIRNPNIKEVKYSSITRTNEKIIFTKTE
jgi:hypothetical protein